MLNYLITVTRDIAAIAVILGLLCAYVTSGFGKRGKCAMLIGAAAGFAGAASVAILKNTTKVIDRSGGTGMWNVWTFALSTLALIVFYVFSIGVLKRKSWGGMIASISAAVLEFTFLFYALPGVLAYPFTFSLNGESVFSTAFFYRLIGYLLGVVLCLLIFLAAYQSSKRMTPKTHSIILNIVLLINGFQQITKAIQVLHAKRIISGHALFVLVRYTSNYSDFFIYGIMTAAFIIPAMLWVRSFRVNEPYENPAQRRKIHAKWRSIRRWSGLLTVCFIIVILNMTWLTDLSNQEVELSPTESCEIRDDALYIPLTQVDDGHLHRFAYTTENNIAVRLIIIKKPNSSSYGVGLDACDICGETGYYERNGQVVCNLCDVVMNINTIGFKGGCNPIVIDYSVENGYIVVPTYTLIEHEKEFKG